MKIVSTFLLVFFLPFYMVGCNEHLQGQIDIQKPAAGESVMLSEISESLVKGGSGQRDLQMLDSWQLWWSSWRSLYTSTLIVDLINPEWAREETGLEHIFPVIHSLYDVAPESLFDAAPTSLFPDIVPEFGVQGVNSPSIGDGVYVQQKSMTEKIASYENSLYLDFERSTSEKHTRGRSSATGRSGYPDVEMGLNYVQSASKEEEQSKQASEIQLNFIEEIPLTASVGFFIVIFLTGVGVWGMRV
ncbi:MAG: hypothetical protein JMN27_03260 [gamma proteobacterium endosymbiont of Lamellibrachia anaximandri]|nr:hypothetical protein [gamma proteobacterium endosymbiont of Lamellibrachia anaximandri]MBL3532832.1 hypothetical protein [gamma proteobacterium endosymbiont of Lamellibrachia anaximandri]MBL3599890.1 hypothetical protein [gamma proteobacterium endosymbiont of Lamellibrachia anaximandri]